jgi:hypothetical protein
MSACHRSFPALLLLSILIAGCSATPEPTEIPVMDTPLPTTTLTPTNTPVIPSVLWNKLYGEGQNEVAWDALVAEDGGLYILGSSGFEFDPEIPGDMLLTRTDPAGEVLWERNYGGSGAEEGLTISATRDGNLLLAGSTDSFGAGGIDTYLIKIDPDGNELWSKTLGGSLDEMAGALESEDGGYVLCGNIVDPNDIIADPGAAGYGGYAGRSNIYLAKTDSEGNELWTRTYGGGNNLLTSKCILTPDGGGMILATRITFPDPGDDIVLMKVDGDGNELWTQTWEEGTMNAYDLIPTSDGNYLVAGSYDLAQDASHAQIDFLFIKVDGAGNEIWSNIFGDPEMIDYAQLVVETMDGGFLAMGDLERDLFSGISDIILVKIDKNGEFEWQEIIRTGTHSMFGTFLPLPDGTFLLTGARFHGGNFDVFSIKVDIGDSGR